MPQRITFCLSGPPTVSPSVQYILQLSTTCFPRSVVPPAHCHPPPPPHTHTQWTVSLCCVQWEYMMESSGMRGIVGVCKGFPSRPTPDAGSSRIGTAECSALPIPNQTCGVPGARVGRVVVRCAGHPHALCCSRARPLCPPTTGGCPRSCICRRHGRSTCPSAQPQPQGPPARDACSHRSPT